MPKSSKTATATEATFTVERTRELFNTKQTSLWEKAVEYLHSQHQVQGYLGFLTGSVEGVDEWVAEFSAFVGYLGRKGQFYHYDGYCISRIEATAKYHRRRWAEAVITQQHWNGLDPTEALCLACIPYATASSLARISNLPAGSLALAECLHKQPYRREEMETNPQYYVNCQAELFSSCSKDAQGTAIRNNHHRWLSDLLIRRIYAGYRGLNEWDIENEEVQEKGVDEVLRLIKDRGSEIQNKWDSDIKALRRPVLEETDADADSRTLVGDGETTKRLG